MKKFLFLVVFLLSLSAAFSKLTTLTRQNFNVMPVPDTVVKLTNTQIANPVEGSAKTWDYSKEAVGSEAVVPFAVANNANFPNAFGVVPDNFEFIALGRGCLYDVYYELNDQHYSAIGFFIKEQLFGIGDLTGNATDSFNFPEQTYKFSSVQVHHKFPVTFGSVNVNNYSYEVNFLLSLKIATFDYKNEPGKKVSYVTITDTVVGCGTLLLPSSYGAPIPINVLLYKRYQTRVDSLYLRGVPAPFLLLQLFGIQQGAETKTSRYTFYRSNEKIYALNFAFNNHTFTSPVGVWFDKKIYNYAGMEDELFASGNTTVYPNPVVNGEFFVRLKNWIGSPCKITILNTIGEIILTSELGAEYSTLKVPDDCPDGFYIFKILNMENQTLDFGKMIIKR